MCMCVCVGGGGGALTALGHAVGSVVFNMHNACMHVVHVGYDTILSAPVQTGARC